MISKTSIWVFVAGLLLGGMVVGWFEHTPSIGPAKAEPWALPDFQFFDTSSPNPTGTGTDEYVSVTGTLMGDDVGYPVNTWNIRCRKNDAVCETSDVSEIGYRQLGEIFVDQWPVASWTPTEIVARGADSTACSTNTLTINRKTKTVAYLSVPANQDKDYCKHYDAHMRVERWTIGNPIQPWGKPL